MSGDYARRVPPRALPVAMAAVVGVLYATGSLLGWGGRAFIEWAEVGAAGAAAISLLLSARLPSRSPDGVPADAAPVGVWRASWRWYGVAAASWFIGALGGALSDGHVR
ncbi:MAG: GGDEF domain-containing protein, partial [Spirillospora sp.]